MSVKSRFSPFVPRDITERKQYELSLLKRAQLEERLSDLAASVFVRDLETDPGDRAIVEAIVVMAHRLGLKVIAEGVETEGQKALLMAVGCEYVQGYLHAKPMTADAFFYSIS